MWFCRRLLTVSGLVFQPLGWTPSLIEFHRSMFLICTFAYIVHQLVLSCYAHVLHLFFIIVSQFQLQFPLMFLTSVGAFSSFCHADTISHARWCSLLSYVHYWKREKFRNFVFATEVTIFSDHNLLMYLRECAPKSAKFIKCSHIYAPHSGKPDEEKERFWNEVFHLLSCIPQWNGCVCWQHEWAYSK